MRTHLIMLATSVAEKKNGASAGPDTTGLQTWAEANVLPVLVFVLVCVGLLAAVGGKTAKIIGIIACVILVGVLYSGSALEFGASLGDTIKP